MSDLKGKANNFMKLQIKSEVDLCQNDSYN